MVRPEPVHHRRLRELREQLAPHNIKVERSDRGEGFYLTLQGRRLTPTWTLARLQVWYARVYG